MDLASEEQARRLPEECPTFRPCIYQATYLKKMKLSGYLIVLASVSVASAFVPQQRRAFITRPVFASAIDTLFEEDDAIIPIAENYLRAKYRDTVASRGHETCNKEDATEILRSILPPVTTSELVTEVSNTLNQFPGDTISENDFVEALKENSYWQSAGPLVVKELMYFDSLYAYYKNGQVLLNNEDYETLKENLSWEGSSVASMRANEALFVTAVASSKRGQAIMDDDEYVSLKKELQKEKSWVAARGQDALERLGLDTFLGYLHRAL